MGHRNICLQNQRCQSVKEGTAGTKDARVYDEVYKQVGMLWSEPEPNLPNNYRSALGQLFSLERRFQKDPNLKSLYQQSIDTDVEK